MPLEAAPETEPSNAVPSLPGRKLTMLSPDHHIDLEDGQFAGTRRRDLEHLVRSAVASGRDLVVHFHGGLVSRKSALKTAAGLSEAYAAGGAYPAFVIWNSDLWTTLRVNLDEIGKEKIFKRLVRRLAQFALSKLLEAGGARGEALELRSLNVDVPANLEQLAESLQRFDDQAAVASPLTAKQEAQLREELEQDRILKREAAAISAGVLPAEELEQALATRGIGQRPEPAATRMSRRIVAEIIEERGPQGERALFSSITLAIHGLKVMRRVIARHRKDRDHGLYTTVVEEVLREFYLDEVGALGWALMKGDTEDAFAADPMRFGGTALVELLGSHWPADRRITLVGHSTGAIYIGHLLQHADAVLDSAFRFDVVLLAPACTFRFLAQKLAICRRRVNAIRVFNLSDELERSYWEVKPIYKGSLLYLVSGMLEPDEVDMPLVGMQRYYSGEKPYTGPELDTVTAYLAGQTVWSVAAGQPGRQTEAAKHGAFDDDESTLESLTHILQHGL